MKRIMPMNKPSKLIIIAAIIIALLIIAVILQLTGLVHFVSTPAKKVNTGMSQTAGENTKGVSPQSSQGTQNGNGSSGTNSKNGSSGETVLVTPTGNFVSDHHPNLSGSPAPNTVESVCNTTPGATCQITFTNTNSGVVKSLPSKATDANGASYWNWKLQDIGLTQGTWKIDATATLDSQSKNASDAMNLEVGP